MYYCRRYTETISVLNETQGLKLLRCNSETMLNGVTLNEELLYVFKNILNV